MSFYRTLLASFVALSVAGPVLAADDMTMTTAPGSATTTQQTTTTTTTTTTKINLNTATAKQLMKVKGINGAKARAIVAYRTKNGKFTDIEDLAKVKGFGKIAAEKLQTIENQLTVE